MDDLDGSDDDVDVVASKVMMMKTNFQQLKKITKQTNPGLLVSPSAVQQEEELAFAACDTDQAEGLTWHEVERCEEKYLLLLTEVGIEAPTKAEFEAADLDGNGALLFNEWKDWVALQI